MKSIILVAIALVAVTAAAPTEKEVHIISSEFVQQPDNSYIYKFQTDDGTSKQETGVVKEFLDKDNKLQKVIVVNGSYTFLDTEGKLQTITYFADENGYQAQGDSIPKNASRR